MVLFDCRATIDVGVGMGVGMSADENNPGVDTGVPPGVVSLRSATGRVPGIALRVVVPTGRSYWGRSRVVVALSVAM